MPPPGGMHGTRQLKIGHLLQTLLPSGVAITECPISTFDGVKAADVAWFSRDRWTPMKEGVVFTTAPEICVEVISPSNTPAEIAEKTLLYFGSGAEEFWTCGEDGKMRFSPRTSPEVAVERSPLCPDLPLEIEI